MMIKKKYCSLIVLLVLVALPKSSKCDFSRLTKRSTDDGACDGSTAVFCTKIINDENGLLRYFSPVTSHQIQNHYKNATANCKVLLCAMAMHAVIVEGEKYHPIPNSPFINDEAFESVIKGSGLAECNNDDNKNNYNTDDSRTEDIYKSTIDDKPYTMNGYTNVNFNHFETTTTSTQRDTQSIIPNEIDGSLNESKHDPRKGIIDILYTNENYTNAAKSKYVSEQTDTELFGNNAEMETVSIDSEYLETTTGDSTPYFIDSSGEDTRFELDVANRIGGAGSIATNEETVAISDSLSAIITSTLTPLESTNVEDVLTSSAPYLSSNGDKTVDTKRILTMEPSATNKSTLSQVGNLIFQLLGEEGYNSFSCNLTTIDEDNASGDVVGENVMYRRTNKAFQSNGKTEKNDPDDSDMLPEIPNSIRDDQKIKFLLLELNILELCNFANNDHENISKKLVLCSNGITKLKTKVNGKTSQILDEYSLNLLKSMKQFKLRREAKMKIIKIINLTDYLSSTIKDSAIPKELQSSFQELKQFLLVELKNEDLSSFHPDSNRKDAFMWQLFDYLIQSKIVDNKQKKLLGIFKKFIRNDS